MIAEELTKVLRPHGYTLSVERIEKNAGWGDFAYAIPIALAFILGFAALQKAGLTSLVTGSSVNYGTAFGLGLIASVSSCLAIVGGLVLSLSASSAKEGGYMAHAIALSCGKARGLLRARRRHWSHRQLVPYRDYRQCGARHHRRGGNVYPRCKFARRISFHQTTATHDARVGLAARGAREQA